MVIQEKVLSYGFDLTENSNAVTLDCQDISKIAMKPQISKVTERKIKFLNEFVFLTT